MTQRALSELLEELSRPPKSEPARSISGERPLVLVIDDDEFVRSSLELLLCSQYQLIMSSSAVEGVKAFKDNVSVVILDVKMKGHDGFWACEQIRKVVPDVPIIFYSAYQDMKDPFEIINRYRPFNYITKDGDSQRLCSAVELAARLYQTTLRSRRILERVKQRKSVGA